MNQVASGNQTAGTILVVDDSPNYRQALRRLLVANGYSVVLASDGESASQLAREQLPDLILLDVNMPGMDGYEACQRLKADTETGAIPVIFISGEGCVLNKVQAFASGGVDFIVKPHDNEEVLARVRTHVALHGLQKHLEERVGERTAELEAAIAELARQIDEREQAEAAVRELAVHHEAVREEERKRIAREIHDELGSLLTALKMEISLARMNAGQDAALQERLGQMRDLADKTIRMVRHVATQLRPAALNLGIVPALEWLAQEFSQRTGIACSLKTGGEIEMDDGHTTAIFRIVQESLTNVARHAEASRVEVSMLRQGGEIVLCIADDGRGFDPASRRDDSFGLLGIRERAQALGAGADIVSSPGAGCRVSIRMPFPGDKP
ncbi:MAG: response regulator [Dechloromonas sp.]|nr:response regulator [Dechloromonas sp.]